MCKKEESININQKELNPTTAKTCIDTFKVFIPNVYATVCNIKKKLFMACIFWTVNLHLIKTALIGLFFLFFNSSIYIHVTYTSL